MLKRLFFSHVTLSHSFSTATLLHFSKNRQGPRPGQTRKLEKLQEKNIEKEAKQMTKLAKEQEKLMKLQAANLENMMKNMKHPQANIQAKMPGYKMNDSYEEMPLEQLLQECIEYFEGMLQVFESSLHVFCECFANE